MARRKSELTSVLGKSKDVMPSLIEGCEDRGGDGSEIFRINTDQKLRDQIVDLLIANRDAIYTVTVNRNLNLKAMIAAGRYDWINPDITDKHFPLDAEVSSWPRGRGTVDVKTELFHYNRSMSTKDVLKDIDRRDCRPATIDELLALGAILF